MKFILPFLFVFQFLNSRAQYAFNNTSIHVPPFVGVSNYLHYPLKSITARTLYQRNVGVIVGLQKGGNTVIELGGEAHWRKISILKKPHIIGATTNLEYNPGDNVIGYKAGMWMKRGRINLTYGGNFVYFNDFKGGSRVGLGPSVGFRLLGFHLVNGINILTKGSPGPEGRTVPANTLYMSLRYYFPVDNKFTWDKETMKKKREKEKERAQRKKKREKEKEKGGQKGWEKLLNIKKKQ